MDAESAIGWLMTPQGRQDPYPAYQVLHACGPVIPASESMVVTVGYQAVDQVLRDPGMSVWDEARMDRNWPGWRDNRAAAMLSTTVPFTDPPDHTRVRTLMAGAFTARRLAAFRAIVVEQAERLCDELAERAATGSPVDVVTAFALPLPVRVMCAILGVPAADHEWFAVRMGHLTSVLELAPSPEDAQRAHEVTIEVEAYLAGLVDARRRDPGDDLTSALVRAHDTGGGALSSEELRANLAMLLAAALDSTTYLLANGVVTLLNRPEHAARLRDDDTFAGPCVEELLRFDTPTQLTVRGTTAPTRIAGLDVPAGAEILLLLGAANRDPRRFDDPDVFRPDRPDNQPLSFGAGMHFCIGAALARMEAQVALPMLLRRLPGLALAGQPVRRDRFTIRGYDSVPVTVGPPN